MASRRAVPDEVLEHLCHVHHERRRLLLAVAGLRRGVPQDQFGEPKSGVVAGVHPAGPPLRQRRAGLKARHGVELSLELAQPAQDFRPHPRHLGHPFQRGAQNPVLRDVLGELVVGDFQRNQHAGPAGNLVRHPDPALDGPEGFVHHEVPLQHAAAQRPVRELRQRFGQGAPKVGVLHRGDGIVPEPLVPRVAEQEQQPAQAEPLLGPHLQLHGGSAHRADGPHRFDPVQAHAHRRGLRQAAGVDVGGSVRIKPLHDAAGEFVEDDVPAGLRRRRVRMNRDLMNRARPDRLRMNPGGPRPCGPTNCGPALRRPRPA